MATKIVGTCALCLADNVELPQEHIIPFALGGRFEWPGLCARFNNDILGGKTDKPMGCFTSVQLVKSLGDEFSSFENESVLMVKSSMASLVVPTISYS